MRRRLFNFFLLLGGFLSIAPAAVHGDATQQWRSYAFAGGQFREVPPPGEIQLRDGYLPFRSYSGLPLREERLPEGTGGIAGICYLQVTGGKLRSAAGSFPLAGEVIEIRGNNLTMAVRADEAGYFLVALPPAAYELRWRNFTRKVTVAKGKTTLVALRGGKRMVD